MGNFHCHHRNFIRGKNCQLLLPSLQDFSVGKQPNTSTPQKDKQKKALKSN